MGVFSTRVEEAGLVEIFADAREWISNLPHSVAQNSLSQFADWLQGGARVNG